MAVDFLEAAKFGLSLIGAISGLYALTLRYRDEADAFLRCSVKTLTATSEWIPIQTTVENKGIKPRPISLSFLLIGPVTEAPVDCANAILGPDDAPIPFETTDDFKTISRKSAVVKDGRAYVPLTFYSDENTNIADELLTYTVVVPRKCFESSVPYAVWIYLFADGYWSRASQDAFILSEPKGERSSIVA